MLENFFAIVATTALHNNLLLVQCVGVSMLFIFTQRLQAAVELSLLSFVVLFLSALLNFHLDYYVLQTLELTSLRLIVFAVVSAGLTALIALLLVKHFPLSSKRHGVTLYFIGSNSGVLGLSWLIAEQGRTETTAITAPWDVIAYALGSALGVAVLMLLFAALRERLDSTAIPAPFRGAPIYLISAGITAMALLRIGGN